MSDYTRLTDRVRDLFDGDEFANLLDEAELMAASDWEMEFVAEIRQRFDRHGIAMYLSERQRDTLEAIARGGGMATDTCALNLPCLVNYWRHQTGNHENAATIREFDLPVDALVEIADRTYRHVGGGRFVGHRHDELPFAVDVVKKATEAHGPRVLTIRERAVDPDEWPRVLTLYFAQLMPGMDESR